MIADLAPLAAVTGLVGVVTVLLRRHAGAARDSDALLTADEAGAIGVPPGHPALLLFTARGCGSCEPAKRVLGDVGRRRRVPVVTVDVDDHQALAAGQRIFRAPTTLVLGSDRRAVARIGGVPRAEAVDDALHAVTS